MHGMIPKTVEMLQRPSDPNRRSASPHLKRDKTRYEKEVEEMKMRSLPDHKRGDSERMTSNGDKASQGGLSASYPTSNRLSDYSDMHRSSSSLGDYNFVYYFTVSTL